MAGQNLGAAGTHPEQRAPTTYELKPVHAQLSDFSDEELKCIRVLVPGTRLEQGATYLNLRDSHRGEFTATGDMTAGADDWYVAKSTIDYQLWN